MSIRVALLLLTVAFLSFYAWKNWFVSVCGALVLMAFIQHPDFPNSLGGIQGMNPWNILLFCCVMGWRSQRLREERDWNLPPLLKKLLIGYGIIVACAFGRLAIDPANLVDYTFASAFSEYFINCFKWVVPGILLFEGCRTRKRIIISMGVVLAIYFGLAVQVIRWMPLENAVSGEQLAQRAAKILENEVGYHRVNLSMMLGGAFWAAVALVTVCKSSKHKTLLLGVAAAIFLGQSLTGGRTGYATWGFIGMVLCVMRWRKFLPLIPLASIAVAVLMPGVTERLLQGFGGQSSGIVNATDDYEITSGRTVAWPYVIEKIQESPIFGFGRQAMKRTGITDYLLSEYNEGFPHPHNAYLELLLDNGIIGFILVVPFYLLILKYSFSLFLDKSDPLYGAIGGFTCALVLALLVAAVGSQTFYPREGSVGMWAAIGIMLRVWLDRSRAEEGEQSELGENLVEETEGTGNSISYA